MNLTRLKRSYGAFLVALTIGSVDGLFFWILRGLGLVRVDGYWRLVRAVARGNTIIAANHPTLLETTIIPLIFWPWGAIWTQRFFVWSVPDGALFPKWLSWLYDLSHCVKVDRSKGNNGSAAHVIVRILRSPATIVVHPEAGRTDSPFRGANAPKKRFGKYQDRTMRRIVSTVPFLALQTEATIYLVWVDIPFKDEANDFKRALWLWITRWETITLSVGEPYQVQDSRWRSVSKTAWLHRANKELGRRILCAGREKL